MTLEITNTVFIWEGCFYQEPRDTFLKVISGFSAYTINYSQVCLPYIDFGPFKDTVWVCTHFPLCTLLFLFRIEEKMETQFCVSKSSIRKSEQGMVSSVFRGKDLQHQQISPSLYSWQKAARHFVTYSRHVCHLQVSWIWTTAAHTRVTQIWSMSNVTPNSLFSPTVMTPSSTTASSLGHAQPSPAWGPCICSSSWNSFLQDLPKTGSSSLFWIQLRYFPHKEPFLRPHHLKQHSRPSPTPAFLPLTHCCIITFPVFQWHLLQSGVTLFIGCTPLLD